VPSLTEEKGLVDYHGTPEKGLGGLGDMKRILRKGEEGSREKSRKRRKGIRFTRKGTMGKKENPDQSNF